MKRMMVTASSLLLLGCGAATDDLQPYVQQVKARHIPFTSELPRVEPFLPQPYTGHSLRPPFTEVKPEAMLSRLAQARKGKCLQPQHNDTPQPLEQYSLDNLSMRGTLGDKQGLWALVRTQDGELFKVGVGSYIGLHHGKVTRVTATSVELEEWLADGKGCWQRHQTRLELSGLEQQTG